MDVDPTCPRCRLADENVIHVLKDCCFAKEAWRCADLGEVWTGTSFDRLHDWWIEAASLLDQENFDKEMVLCWPLWGSRNDAIKNKGKDAPSRVASFALNYYLEFQSAQEQTRTDLVISDGKWEKPTSNYVKVNFDGATNAALHMGGRGAIIRDGGGAVLGACSMPHFGISDPLTVEAMAAVEALKFTEEMGFNDIALEGDSVKVVNLLKDEGFDRSCIGNLIMEGRRRLQGFRKSQVLHIRRKGNLAADSLAKYGLKANSNMYWVEECPSFLSEISANDCNSF
ncbi:hypothetical protein REPUB_Repub05bG0013100 [Reevesia pubescens]